MRACKQCGLSIGDTATFCPVCGTVADQGEASPTTTPPVSVASHQAVEVPAEEVRPRSERPRAASSSPPTMSPRHVAAQDGRATRGSALSSGHHRVTWSQARSATASPCAATWRDVFNRLSLVLKRSDLSEEALEEINYRGLSRPCRRWGFRHSLRPLRTDQGLPYSLVVGVPEAGADRTGAGHLSLDFLSRRSRAYSSTTSSTGSGCTSRRETESPSCLTALPGRTACFWGFTPPATGRATGSPRTPEGRRVSLPRSAGRSRVGRRRRGTGRSAARRPLRNTARGPSGRPRRAITSPTVDSSATSSGRESRPLRPSG